MRDEDLREWDMLVTGIRKFRGLFEMLCYNVKRHVPTLDTINKSKNYNKTIKPIPRPHSRIFISVGRSSGTAAAGCSTRSCTVCWAIPSELPSHSSYQKGRTSPKLSSLYSGKLY
jgi:hypothetical protein